MRLQGGPLHVGWRCREHLVYVGVQPSGGAVDVPTIAAKPLVGPLALFMFFHPPQLRGYLFDDPVTSLGGYVFQVR